MTKRKLILNGNPPMPALETCHDVRHMVVCAYARCRQLGDERQMIAAKSTEFQSTSDGRACYHGRCYAKQFGVEALLKLPKETLRGLAVGDVGQALAEKIIQDRLTQKRRRKSGAR